MKFVMIKQLKIVNVILVIILGAMMLFSQMASAQSNQYTRQKKKALPLDKGVGTPSAKETKAKDGVLDISGLEEKFWSAKDTDFSVVQNRTYTKEKKYAFSAQYGQLINDGYSTGGGLLLSGNYFMSERWGVELTYQTYDVKDSDQTKAFLNLAENTNKLVPEHGKIQNFIGAGLSWVPFYAKVSVLGKKILYLDLAITPVLGLTEYEQQADIDPNDNAKNNKKKSAVTVGVDITQYFFLSTKVALRMDFRNRWYSEDVLDYRTGQKDRSKTNQTTLIGVGMTYYF